MILIEFTDKNDTAKQVMERMHKALVGSRCYIDSEVAICGMGEDEEVLGLYIGELNDHNIIFKIDPSIIECKWVTETQKESSNEEDISR